MSKQPQAERSKRDAFSSRAAFVLACVGSAVGVSTIWLFPSRVAQFGGAAYLIPYFICLFALGFSGVLGEMSFGRAMQSGPIGAFSKAIAQRGVRHSEKIGTLLGLIPTLGSLGIAIGYSVVVGWFLCYLVMPLVGPMPQGENLAQTFATLAGPFGSVPYHALAVLFAMLVMGFGVSRGIERLNKVMMPVFFILFAILLVYVATLPGSQNGYAYLSIPDWSKILEPRTWVFALGQAFFSLSLAGSGTIVYGSYLSKDADAVGAARNIALVAACAAILAALVIIPALFAFGVGVGAGPSLLFITMPQVFEAMPFGGIFQILFFIAALFAALTSLVNLFETPVEALQGKLGLSRRASVAIAGTIAFVIGLFLEDGNAVSAWMDAISNYVIPLGALIAAIMFYWVCRPGFAREQASLGRKKPVGRWFDVMTKYVFVVVTFLVLVLGVIFGGIG